MERTVGFDKWFFRNENKIITNIIQLLSINTMTPNEYKVYGFIEDYLKKIGFYVEKRQFAEKIIKHQHFVSYKGFDLKKRYNLCATSHINNNFKSKTIFNVHLDIVPPCTNQMITYSIRNIKNENIYGRGACDTKTNLIILCEAIRFLQENNITRTKAVEMHLVSEEEKTGNGTLSLVLDNVYANEVIVMEPTGLELFKGHRGCLTVNIETFGDSVHMGSLQKQHSAIDRALQIVKLLKKMEIDMVEEVKEKQDFLNWKNAIKINIGKISGGEWAGSVPEKCEVECNIGFSPKYSVEDMKEKIKSYCFNQDNNKTTKYCRITFGGLKNNAYIEKGTSLLLKSINMCGIKQNDVLGWNVSCDAHLYHDIAKLPTYIWGCGKLEDAHSAHEKVSLNEIKTGISILANYLST